VIEIQWYLQQCVLVCAVQDWVEENRTDSPRSLSSSEYVSHLKTTQQAWSLDMSLIISIRRNNRLLHFFDLIFLIWIFYLQHTYTINKKTFDQSPHSSKKVDPRPKINTHLWGSYQFNKNIIHNIKLKQLYRLIIMKPIYKLWEIKLN